METEKVQFPSNVILIDVTYLNFMIEDIKKYFEKRLGRSLQTIDFALFIEAMAVDGGCEVGENEIQTLLVYDKTSTKLYNCLPSDIQTELDGMAFKSEYGEFLFTGVPCEDIIPREDLLMDILSLVLKSKDMTNLMVVAADQLYDSKVVEMLMGAEGKEIVQYRMDESGNIPYRWELLVFPIMQALGIQPDEI